MGSQKVGHDQASTHAKTFLVVIAGCVCVCVYASSGERAGMVLNILQCTGQSPTKKKYPAPSAKGAEVEKYCLSISTS